MRTFLFPLAAAVGLAVLGIIPDRSEATWLSGWRGYNSCSYTPSYGYYYNPGYYSYGYVQPNYTYSVPGYSSYYQPDSYYYSVPQDSYYGSYYAVPDSGYRTYYQPRPYWGWR